MVTKSKSRRPNAVRQTPTASPAIASAAMRARFVDEYMRDSNGTQAAIRAGASPKGAHTTAHRWLRRVDIGAEIARRQAAMSEKVQRQVQDRYEVTTDRITRELAKLAFANAADYGRVSDGGEFYVDFTATTNDQMAALQSIKSRRTYRTTGETTTEDVVTEFRLGSKREALVDLGKVTGMFKDGVDVTVPVRFVVERTERSKHRAEADG